MAKMLRNVGEYLSGKIGNVVFVRTKDKSYVRRAPDCSKVVWTEQQTNYRKRTSKIGAMYRSLKYDMIAQSWAMSQPGMPVFARFMKLNQPALQIDGTLIDPLMIQVTNGPLIMALNLEVSRMENEPGTLFVTWENDPNLRRGRLDDILYAVIYDAVKEQFTYPLETFMEREQEVGTILFPEPEMMENPTHVFLFWVSDEPVSYSNSMGFVIPDLPV